MGQNRPKFRILYADKHTGLKKGPPPPVVANMSHEDIIPSGTLKTTSTFESQPLLWVAGRKGPVQSGPDGRLLEHKTCHILAAERLRLMRFDNRLIMVSFLKSICLLKW